MAISPLFVRWIKLTVTDKNDVDHSFECAVTQAGLTSTGGTTVSLNTLCPSGTFSEATERVWQLVVTGVQDVESAESFQLFLLDHDGEKATFLYYPKTDKTGTPMGRGFTGEVTLAPPDNVGNVASGAYATFTATLPLQGKYSSVDANGNPIPNKAAVKPGDAFTGEPTITASDAPNAAKLAGLGYVVDATTIPWAATKNFTVNAFAFFWNEAAAPAAWAAGSHTVMAASTRDKS